ncbi:acyl-CoA dehydrogenase family protein [Frigidibacter sp. MR17.14]|uniref:acyl-CoA dehydrogenase family protein n=1 Tax=Frigidibacter sp. MR17.14 TaxID=3126509 RepID=UPI003012FF6D
MLHAQPFPAPQARALPEAFADAWRASAEQADRDGRFPRAHLADLQAAGLLGLTAPLAHGGAGAGLGQAAETLRHLGRGCPSTALVVAMHYVNLAQLPKGRWPKALLDRVLGAGARRGELINALRVERDLGTPLRGGLPATTARRTATGWSLSGRKIYSTGSEVLGWAIVWARTDEAAPRVGQFVVPMTAPGIRIEPSWDTLGLRGSSSHDVIFEAVPLPFDHAADLRPPADWAGAADATAGWGNLLIAALYTGVAEAARDWIAGFLKDRVPANLGHSLAELPRAQEALGAIEALLHTNLRLIRSAAAEIDAGTGPSGVETGLLKLTATENAIAAVERAVRLAGNHAIARHNPLERHLRDVLCGRIHSPQEDTALIAAGRRALGL